MGRSLIAVGGVAFGVVYAWMVRIAVSVRLPVRVACSRLYLGVHYLSDTMAAASLALVVCGLTMLAARRWLRPVEPPGGAEGPHSEPGRFAHRDVA